MQNNQPVWEHGIRCHGYWLGIKQVGFVGLTPPMVKPTVYTWSLNIPHYEAVKGKCLSLRQAKRFVERAYAQQSMHADQKRADPQPEILSTPAVFGR